MQDYHAQRTFEWHCENVSLMCVDMIGVAKQEWWRWEMGDGR